MSTYKKVISLKIYDILIILVDFYMNSSRFFFCYPDPNPRFLKCVRIRNTSNSGTFFQLAFSLVEEPGLLVEVGELALVDDVRRHHLLQLPALRRAYSGHLLLVPGIGMIKQWLIKVNLEIPNGILALLPLLEKDTGISWYNPASFSKGRSTQPFLFINIIFIQIFK